MVANPINSIVKSVFTVIILSYIVRSENVSGTCDHPGEPVNGESIPDQSEYSTGEEITFICSQNLILIGNETTKCQGNKSWSSPVPHCGWNVGFGKETKCVEEKGFEVLKISSITDGMAETCLRRIKELTLLSYFQERINVSHVNVFINENSTRSFNISVQLYKDTNLKVFTDKPCELIKTVYHNAMRRYIFTCGSVIDPQLAQAIQVAFPSKTELELCEINVLSPSDENLMLNKDVYIKTHVKEKCFTSFTDGNISSSSTLILTNPKTLLINLIGTYEVEMFIFTMNLNNIYHESQKRNDLNIDVEIGNDTQDGMEDNYRLCRKLSYTRGDWINDTKKFTCQGHSTSCNTVRLTFKGNLIGSIQVNLREFQMLTTGSDLEFQRPCKTKEHSPNCIVEEIYDSNGTQCLLYSAKQNYLLFGNKVNRCSKGSWKSKAPSCIQDTSVLQTSKNNEKYKAWGIVSTSICIVLAIIGVILVSTKRIRWRKHGLHNKTEFREERGEDEMNINYYEEIDNDIYNGSRLDKTNLPLPRR